MFQYLILGTERYFKLTNRYSLIRHIKHDSHCRNGRKRSADDMTAAVEAVKEEDMPLMETAQKPESGNFLSM
jgi:hypothetical protein